MKTDPPSKSDRSVPGGLLTSKSAVFQVQSILGEGAFGKVLKCVRVGRTTPIAIKVIKSSKFYRQQAKKEIENLTRLKDLEHDKCSIIRIHGAFYDRGYYCMIFEHLDRSLFDYMNQQRLRRLPLFVIKWIVCQLAKALEALNRVGLTHMDIKMDNIMLVNQKKYPFLIKLIDFGLAEEMSRVAPGSKVQPLFYRAPEVMLGLPLTEAIDIWSLGCLAARLYLGGHLYHASSESEMGHFGCDLQMRCIVETQGQPPDHVLDAGVKTQRFFKRSSKTSWKLKAKKCKQAVEEHADEPPGWKLNSLEDILIVFPVRDKEKLDLVLLMDLLAKMLHLEPTKRITPQKILKHGFVTSLAAFIAGVWKSSVVKITRKSSHTSGGAAKKIPDRQRPATEVQPKPLKRKRTGGDDDLHVRKRVKIPNSSGTAEDGEKQQRDIKTSRARKPSGASRKRHLL